MTSSRCCFLLSMRSQTSHLSRWNTLKLTALEQRSTQTTIIHFTAWKIYYMIYLLLFFISLDVKVFSSGILLLGLLFVCRSETPRKWTVLSASSASRRENLCLLAPLSPTWDTQNQLLDWQPWQRYVEQQALLLLSYFIDYVSFSDAGNLFGIKKWSLDLFFSTLFSTFAEKHLPGVINTLQQELREVDTPLT